MGFYVLYNSFDDIVKEYNNTLPIRGKRKSEDLRPLGKRARWWERIIKVNDNKYALSDGNWFHSSFNEILADTVHAITWERKEDGDYVTIRNNINGGTSISRYNFLSRYTPRGLDFTYKRDGKHYVKDHTGNRHFLPKSKIDFDYTNKAAEILFDAKLTFKDEGNGIFTRVNGLHPTKTNRLDKDLCKEYEPLIQKMYTWMQTVLPIMAFNWEVISEYKQMTCDNTAYWNWKGNVNKALVREVLYTDDHPKYVAFAVALADEAGLIVPQGYLQSGGRFDPTQEGGYQKFRSVVRKCADMYKTELM